MEHTELEQTSFERIGPTLDNTTTDTGITTVFFDVGHTLLTPAVSEGKVFSEEALRHGVQLDAALVDENISRMYELYEQLYEQDESFWADEERAVVIWHKMYEFLCELTGVDTSKHKEIAMSVHRRYFTAESWKTFDDVIPALKRLKQQGIRMGLISNWDSTLGDIIEGLGLASYFEIVLSSTVVKLHKPMPEIFKYALEQMGVAPAEALHVGDHLIADVQGAHAVGIMPVLIDRQGGVYDALPLGTLVISSFAELADYLAS
ncbi:MAG: HAD family hydrolase [Coriobacteriia bacterium]|nr:HAD family hydrolase [Coriobacteriia bacterium]